MTGTKIKQMLAGAGLAFVLVAILPGAASAITCPDGSIREGQPVTNASDCNVADVEEKSQLPTVVTGLIGTLVALLGIVAVFVIIYGGVQLALSGGDPGKVKTARNAILYGVIGLVVAMLAWVIVNFVIASAAGGSDEKDTKDVKDSSLLMENVIL